MRDFSIHKNYISGKFVWGARKCWEILTLYNLALLYSTMWIWLSSAKLDPTSLPCLVFSLEFVSNFIWAIHECVALANLAPCHLKLLRTESLLKNFNHDICFSNQNNNHVLGITPATRSMLIWPERNWKQYCTKLSSTVYYSEVDSANMHAIKWSSFDMLSVEILPSMTSHSMEVLIFWQVKTSHQLWLDWPCTFLIHGFWFRWQFLLTIEIR